MHRLMPLLFLCACQSVIQKDIELWFASGAKTLTKIFMFVEEQNYSPFEICFLPQTEHSCDIFILILHISLVGVNKSAVICLSGYPWFTWVKRTLWKTWTTGIFFTHLTPFFEGNIYLL